MSTRAQLTALYNYACLGLVQVHQKPIRFLYSASEIVNCLSRYYIRIYYVFGHTTLLAYCFFVYNILGKYSILDAVNVLLKVKLNT